MPGVGSKSGPWESAKNQDGYCGWIGQSALLLKSRYSYYSRELEVGFALPPYRRRTIWHQRDDLRFGAVADCGFCRDRGKHGGASEGAVLPGNVDSKVTAG